MRSMNNKVIEYIKANGTQRNPVLSYKITEATGVGGVAIRRAVNKARCEGIPICSCGEGYFYSKDKSQIINTIQSLVNRTISVEKAVEGLLKTLNTIESEE